MNITGIAAILIILLLIAWLLWLERGEMDKHSVQQGVLLAVLMAAWFFRIVFMEAV